MKIVTLDIETIPDPAACALVGVDPSDGFPPWPLHQLMCVSLLTVQRDSSHRCHFDIETYSRTQHGERGIVASVERAIADAQQLITYNGRAFDIPVLLARAIATNEYAPTLVKAGRRAHAGFHLDMMDAVSAGGAAPRPKLAHICAALSIPVKMEAAGGGVAELAAAGDFGRIQRYCETDVVATWLLSQLWQSAELSELGLDQWAALAEWIRSEQPRLAHMLPYLTIPPAPGGGMRIADGSAPLFEF